MPLHDRHLRVTPLQRAFPDGATRDRLLDTIAGEVRERGLGDDDPGAFALLPTTRRALAELRDPEGDGDGGHTHAILLFHAFHVRAAGGSHLLASVPVCRWAVEGSGGEGAHGMDVPNPVGAPGSKAPSGDDAEPAGASGAKAGTGEDPEPSDSPGGLPSSTYVQLPQHLFWVREDPAERPLSLDGFFWTVTGETLHVLGVVDFQSGGDGIRVLPLPGVPFGEREQWLHQSMRPGGEDFRSDIPGGEMEGLYELRTAGELLKLAARLDRFVARFPDSARPGTHESSPATDHGEGVGLPPYRRLELD
ncbi:MAG: hypothetical protein JSU98_10700 [Gemmatimonadales bacterium]|nr:MAG: hypothetical protein JSU98_10700 [Gemmatimonadales bacterium]